MSTRQYSLNESNQKHAAFKGLADADWYRTPIDKAQMVALLERRNFPAIRDTIIWLSLLIISAIAGALLWPTPWALVPFLIYGVIYASSSDSRWHESSHGTVFKTDWLNVALYEIASFMMLRESTVWRWSHFRHHSDTLVVGRDPEIVVERPTNFKTIFLIFTGIPSIISACKNFTQHALGRLSEAETLFIPEEEVNRVFFKARIYIAIYVSVIGISIYLNSWLPLMYIGLPTLYGSWLAPIYGLTQHAGLVENQLDHRLNCRTVHMNIVNRFLYWNMGYHVEHHMYPMVPYYNLPKLHALMKADCPETYPSIWAAWREIIPALKKQQQDSNYYVPRKLPSTAHSSEYSQGTIAHFATGDFDAEGWIEINAQSPQKESAIRFDHDGKSYAIYRTNDNQLYATDGICTHGNTHLVDGLVCGNQIECPKHSGRFDVTDGSCQRHPVSIPLQTHLVQERENGSLWFKPNSLNSNQREPNTQASTFKVVSNQHLTPFIKELTLEPEQENFTYQAGDYIQLEIPRYQQIQANDFDIPAEYKTVWKTNNFQTAVASNSNVERRNYSIANSPQPNHQLQFTIRIALPPHEKNHPMGSGSAYVFSLKAGDKVRVYGANGAFHIKQSDKEMIYVGGGAGMAPIKAHISQLLDKEASKRKISFWYGARTEQDIFYQDYFSQLTASHPNFDFTIALSAIHKNNEWTGPIGFIHDALEQRYLIHHKNPQNAEYYLCGPPMMITAMGTLLKKYGVSEDAISYDIF